MKTKYIIILIACFAFLGYNSTYAQEKWTVSDDEKAISNPLPMSDEQLEAGQDLFAKKCQSCHGEAGKGKQLPLVPDMKDLGNPDFLKSVTAGEMYTKLTKGKGAMPRFKSQLSDEKRWEIVGFLRNLIGEKPAGAKAKTSEAKTESSVSTEGLKLILDADEKSHSVTATLEAKDERGNTVTPSGIKVQIFVKRYFGNLLIGTDKTDSEGKITVEIPEDLPVSYEDGKLEVLAKIKNSNKYGEVSDSLKVKIGAANPHKNLLLERSFWGRASMAPLWLIITYTSVVVGIWLFIFYVISLIGKIKKAGE